MMGAMKAISAYSMVPVITYMTVPIARPPSTEAIGTVGRSAALVEVVGTRTEPGSAQMPGRGGRLNALVSIRARSASGRSTTRVRRAPVRTSAPEATWPLRETGTPLIQVPLRDPWSTTVTRPEASTSNVA